MKPSNAPHPRALTRWCLHLALALALASCRPAAQPVPDPPAPRDSDGDGVFDGEDRCVHRAEDFDGFEDEDGCPDFDNDGDGIADERDLCLSEAEQLNGFEDADGCPDADVALCRDCRATRTLLVVLMFEAGSAELREEQRGELDEVGQTLLEAQGGGRLAVEVVGHSSDWGEEVDQRALAKERADLVRRCLIDLGLPARAITARGEGAGKPRVPHGSAQARLLNDRVEILVPSELR